MVVATVPVVTSAGVVVDKVTSSYPVVTAGVVSFGVALGVVPIVDWLPSTGVQAARKHINKHIAVILLIVIPAFFSLMIKNIIPFSNTENKTSYVFLHENSVCFLSQAMRKNTL